MERTDLRQLVADLSKAGYQSPVLERLRRRVDAEAQQASLQREIVQEMASSLGRAEEKLLGLLLELELLGAQRATASADLVRAFNDKREAAVRALYDLKVTREAVGLRSNEILNELYPIPPRWAAPR
jgi:hypothetical protein